MPLVLTLLVQLFNTHMAVFIALHQINHTETLSLGEAAFDLHQFSRLATYQ